jgi:hypothetical protein
MLLAALLAVAALTGCGSGTDPLTKHLPAANVVPGWRLEGEIDTFDSETLFELVNGQAESYFAYGFEAAAVARYVSDEGEQRLRVELFRLASPADAYGLFSVTRSGEPTAVGSDGDMDPGRRLAFWQDDTYGRIMATQPVDDAVLLSFAQAITGGLPEGGEPPAIVRELPTEGLQPLSVRFFRQELSIQNWLCLSLCFTDGLGGENLLLLPGDDQAAGVLADYDRGSGPFQVLLVEYPEAGVAQAAAQALSSAGVQSLVAVKANDMRLAAVFGDLVDREMAEDMVRELLK